MSPDALAMTASHPEVPPEESGTRSRAPRPAVVEWECWGWGACSAAVPSARGSQSPALGQHCLTPSQGRGAWGRPAHVGFLPLGTAAGDGDVGPARGPRTPAGDGLGPGWARGPVLVARGCPVTRQAGTVVWQCHLVVTAVCWELRSHRCVLPLEGRFYGVRCLSFPISTHPCAPPSPVSKQDCVPKPWRDTQELELSVARWDTGTGRGGRGAVNSSPRPILLRGRRPRRERPGLFLSSDRLPARGWVCWGGAHCGHPREGQVLS